MSLFFETLFLKDNIINNLKYHNYRLNTTIKDNYNIDKSINLADEVNIKSLESCRCKVIYDTKIRKIELFPILKRKFNSFKILNSDIEYKYKYLDRTNLDTLYKQRDNCDDIIIVKDDLVRDTSIANIAYFDGTNWITPKKPLLPGTMRAYMLDHKLLLEKDVKIKDIKNAKKIALINAILGFFEIDNPRFI
jgi:4-amino-4-deoxychorismate lyase